MSGLGVTAVVQSSTATALIVAAFVGQGLITLPLALAVMLGADIGTSLMTVVFSFDLSWLSPLLIFWAWCCSSRASRRPSAASAACSSAWA
jgi:phosphate:Na+ symporter